MRVLFFILVPWLFLVSVASAEDVFVRNRAFTGVVEGAGSSLYLEAAPLFESLMLDVERSDEALTFEGIELHTKMVGDKLLVNLNQAAEVVGLKVVRNSSLGTVDVFRVQNSSRAAAAEGWGNSGTENGRSGSDSPGGAVLALMAAFKRCDRYDFSRPEHFDNFLREVEPNLTAKSFVKLKGFVEMMKSGGRGTGLKQMVSGPAPAQCKILKETIDGEHAVVKVKYPGQEGDEDWDCYLENGEWRAHLPL